MFTKSWRAMAVLQLWGDRFARPTLNLGARYIATDCTLCSSGDQLVCPKNYTSLVPDNKLVLSRINPNVQPSSMGNG